MTYRWQDTKYLRPYKALLRYAFKLLLNTVLIAAFATLVWASYNTFTHKWASTPGVISVVASLAGLVLMWAITHGRRLRYQRPKIFSTVLLGIIIAVICTFAGVQPLAGYKDKLVSYWDEWRSSRQTEQAIAETSPMVTMPNTVAPSAMIPNPVLTIIPTPSPTIVEQPLLNPTYQRLLDFLRSDKTDEQAYVYPTFVCDDFANMLKRDANQAGWRCAKVVVKIEGYPDWYNYGIPSNTGHSCNAFETTDKGLIFIDCTRSPGMGPANQDKKVDVKIGMKYIPVSLFPALGWSEIWESMGTVTNIDIYW